jgi:hypothetical protein
MRNIYHAGRIIKLPGKKYHTFNNYGCWTKQQFLKVFFGVKYKRRKKQNAKTR